MFRCKTANSDKMIRAAIFLRKHWKIELEVIRMCVDCYFYWAMKKKNDSYSTKVCTKPHLLVYTQEPEEEGSRWWPAKVLSISKNNTVNIESFGDNLRSYCEKYECILYADTTEDILKKSQKAVKSMNTYKKKEFVRAFKVEKIVNRIFIIMIQ